MKKLVAACAAFIVSASVILAQDTTITITPYIGPYDVTQEFVGNVINGVTGTASPSTPVTIANNTVNIRSLMCTPSFNSWTGSVAGAVGPFAARRGNYIYFAFDIVQSEAFIPNDVAFMISSPFFSFNNTFGGINLNYDLQAQGRAADGTVYTTGPMNKPVTRLQGIAVAYGIQVDGNSQQSINDNISFWSPFDLTGGYSINGCSSSVTIHVAVPEPSCLAISLVFGGILCFRKKW